MSLSNESYSAVNSPAASPPFRPDNLAYGISFENRLWLTWVYNETPGWVTARYQPGNEDFDPIKLFKRIHGLIPGRQYSWTSSCINVNELHSNALYALVTNDATLQQDTGPYTMIYPDTFVYSDTVVFTATQDTHYIGFGVTAGELLIEDQMSVTLVPII